MRSSHKPSPRCSEPRLAPLSRAVVQLIDDGARQPLPVFDATRVALAFLDEQDAEAVLQQAVEA